MSKVKVSKSKPVFLPVTVELEGEFAGKLLIELANLADREDSATRLLFLALSDVIDGNRQSSVRG